jgi:hypothetical protein
MRRRTRSASAGFTIVELMVSSTLAGVVMTAVLSTFVFMGRNLARLASYEALETESRKALTYLRRDFGQAQAVKSGTSPTDSTVTLVVPSGEVTYTYNSTTHSLRRQTNFGSTTDLNLLQNSSCECTAFSFGYYTISDGAPTDQVTPAANVPYSIKQIQVRFVVESPSTWSAMTRTRYEAASARFVFRNKVAPTGS